MRFADLKNGDAFIVTFDASDPRPDAHPGPRLYVKRDHLGEQWEFNRLAGGFRHYGDTTLFPPDFIVTPLQRHPE